MIELKNAYAFATMRTAGHYLAELFEILETSLSVGMSTLDLEMIIQKFLADHKMVSQSMGYAGYRYASCISLNDEVVHGIPRADRLIKAGDLVKVDICASWQGYCADLTRCFMVPPVSARVTALVAAAQRALDAGIACAVPGAHVTDISAAVQQEVERAGFQVVRDFAGHGIGKKMHEEPEILNYGRPGRGPVIREGMAFALEPMITEGHYQVRVDRDGWTARTVDGSLAAHVEDTVLVTAQGPEVSTRTKK
jgi:methionyl aminopeptidase